MASTVADPEIGQEGALEIFFEKFSTMGPNHISLPKKSPFFHKITFFLDLNKGL